MLYLGTGPPYRGFLVMSTLVIDGKASVFYPVPGIGTAAYAFPTYHLCFAATTEIEPLRTETGRGRRSAAAAERLTTIWHPAGSGKLRSLPGSGGLGRVESRNALPALLCCRSDRPESGPILGGCLGVGFGQRWLRRLSRCGSVMPRPSNAPRRRICCSSSSTSRTTSGRLSTFRAKRSIVRPCCTGGTIMSVPSLIAIMAPRGRKADHATCTPRYRQNGPVCLKLPNPHRLCSRYNMNNTHGVSAFLGC